MYPAKRINLKNKYFVTEKKKKYNNNKYNK